MRSTKQSPLWVLESSTNIRTCLSSTNAIWAWSNMVKARDLVVWTPVQLNVTHFPQLGKPSSAGATLS